jgi:hypothetical protein
VKAPGEQEFAAPGWPFEHARETARTQNERGVQVPALKMTFPHQLGRQTAVERLHTRLEKLKERHGEKIKNLRETWSDNVLDFGFSTFGFTIQGKVTVEDDTVNLDGQIPFAAMMFKGKIEQELRQQMTKLLA